MGKLDAYLAMGAILLVIGIGVTYYSATPEPVVKILNDTEPFSIFEVVFISYDMYYDRNVILFEEIIEPEINKYTEEKGYEFRFDFKVIASNCGGETNELIIELEKKGTDVVIGSNCVACAAYSYMNDNDMILVSASKTQPSFSMKDDMMFEITPPDQNTAHVTAAMIDSWGITHPILLKRGDKELDIINQNFVDAWEGLGHQKYSVVSRSGSKDYVKCMSKLEDEIKSLVNDGLSYDEICVMSTFYETAARLEDTEDYPETRKVVWFGTENFGEISAPLNSSKAKEVGAFYPLMTTNSGKWDTIKVEYEELTGESATQIIATSYDAAWVIALTVMSTESNDPDVLKASIRDVAFTYQGLTGWIQLDENGDRYNGCYEIRGYTSLNKPKIYGWYDAETFTVTWNDETLSEIGLTRFTD